jgi:hypothetical protein
VVSDHRMALFKKVMSLGALTYVAFAIAPVLFLVHAVVNGAQETLALLGLSNTAASATPVKQAQPFLWLLLILFGLSAVQLMSPWLRGLWAVIRSVRYKP